MQETRVVTLTEQDALKLTTAELFWPTTNRSIHGRGVLREDGTLTVDEDEDFERETASAVACLLGAGTR